MTSSRTSSLGFVRKNYKNSNTAVYGVSTLGEDGASRRVSMTELPRKTTIDDIIEFFKPSTIEGITIKYAVSSLGTLAFVQFERPCDFTEALLKNCLPFLGERAAIRPYKKGSYSSSQSGSNRRPPAQRANSESTTMPSKRSSASKTYKRIYEHPTREAPSSSSNINPSRSPDTARSPTGPRISDENSSYRAARCSPPRRRTRSRSPPSRGHARARSPERPTHSDRPKRYDRSKRSSDRARSRSTSTDRGRCKRNRDRSPSLDRNFRRRPDPFSSNDIPNPNEEMLVRQSIALWKQQPQAEARIPVSHVFGANGAPLPNLPGTGLTQAIAYTTQASQSSYVSQSSRGLVGSGLFNGNLERIFAEQGQNKAHPPLRATSNGTATTMTVASEMPAGVELILKLILEHKSARHLSMFQLDSVVKYLQDQKKIIQQVNAAGDQDIAIKAIEAPSPVAAAPATLDNADDVVNVNSSDDLRNRLNQQQSDESLFELARKIQKYRGANVKEEKE